MNSMRNFICVLMALMLAAFALPGIAGPLKTYSILIQSSGDYTTNPQQVVVPVPVTVFVKNISQQSANSNIGSLRFTLAGLVIVDEPIVGAACPNAICSLDTATNTITVTNISPPIQAHQRFPVSFRVTSCGDGDVTNALVTTGSQLGGATFKSASDSNFFDTLPPTAPVPSSATAGVSCGQLACSSAFTVPDSDFACTSTDSAALECVTGFRGPNKDGFCTAGDPVSYLVTNTLATTNKLLHVEWATEETGTFTYRVNALTNANLQFSWFTSADLIAADTCIGYPSQAATPALPPTDLLPKAYATLAQAVALNDKKIVVNPGATEPALGTDVVIGPAGSIERMTVTKIVSATNTWTVTRAVGGTNKVAHPLLGLDNITPTSVMSTPLKILQAGVPSPYTAGNQAQMCIAQGPTLDVPSGHYYFWVIDIGDGWSTQ